MRKRHLSLPVVVLITVAALVVGSFGTATAAGITKAQVKKIAAKVVAKKAKTLTVANALGVPDNAINSADIANGSVTAADLAPGTITAPLYARVSSAGALNAAASSRAVSAVRNSVGSYTVTFDRDVSNCSAVATPFDLDQADLFITAQTAGGLVTIDSEDPDLEETQTDNPFNLLVVCK